MTGTRITARELNRATLARQLLLRREALEPAEGARVVALQAQQPASPYVALAEPAHRLRPGRTRHGVHGSPGGQATSTRLTLHAVHADDHPAFREAMHPGPRLPAG
ncbi:Winged helix DNA-binding domain-containing protein OS=Streptomyces microflavus OX=1919 GN=Smic_03460 PE=4 SV=1 [Streptomyces microflavus]